MVPKGLPNDPLKAPRGAKSRQKRRPENTQKNDAKIVRKRDQNKPVLAWEREARYNEETLLTGAQHLRQQTLILIGNPAQAIC